MMKAKFKSFRLFFINEFNEGMEKALAFFKSSQKD